MAHGPGAAPQGDSDVKSVSSESADGGTGLLYPGLPRVPPLTDETGQQLCLWSCAGHSTLSPDQRSRDSAAARHTCTAWCA